MSDPKKNRGDGSSLDSFLDGWNRHMDSYQVGKYSQEIENAQAKPVKHGSCCDDEKS